MLSVGPPFGATVLHEGVCQWCVCIGHMLCFFQGTVFQPIQPTEPPQQFNPIWYKIKVQQEKMMGTCLSLYMFRSLVIMKSPSRQFVFQLYLKTSSWILRSQWGIYRRISSISP